MHLAFTLDLTRMSLKTIERAGIPVWSPIENCKSLIAVGGIGSPSSSDFNVAADLEIYSMYSGSRIDSSGLIAREHVDSGFRAISWADIGPACPSGVIAGGLSNGTLCLWDVNRLLSASHSSPSHSRTGSSMLFSQHLHGDRPVSCLEFNPQKSTLLATGGGDGTVQVVSIERPNQPDVFRGVTTSKHANSEVLSVAWNRKVQHILASASNQGLLVVWDLKNKKEVVTIKDPGNRTRPSGLSWNPDLPTQLLVAYNDDTNPCIQLWDMRNCSYPFREFQEHTRGVTYASFCDLDSNFIVSSGRDNRGVCWSLQSGQLDAYSDLNLSSPASKLDWSPHLPGFIAAAQTSGIISIHSISQRQTSNASRYTPRWTKMPCGSSFGFGGKFVTFGSLQGHQVSVSVVPDEPAVVNEADRFEQYLASDLRPYCSSKAVDAHDDHEKLTWKLISLLFHGQDARSEVIGTMGIDVNEIQALAEKYLGRPMNAPSVKPSHQIDSTLDRADGFADAGNLDAEQLDDLFDQLAKNSEQQTAGAIPAGQIRLGSPQMLSIDADAEVPPTDWSQGPEAIVKQSILIGDITTAVECCMQCGRFADALFIAGAGDQALWKRVRDEYANKQKDPFIRLVGYVMAEELEKFVQHADLSSWVETLVILVTYSRAENYRRLVEMLAERLEKERFDVRSAVLCYLACGSFSNTVRIWASMSHAQASQSQALQGLVEKMSCLFTAIRPQAVDPIFSHKMQQYATLLANSGRILAAMRCLILVPDSTESRILKDRIYNAAPAVMGQILRNPPPFPFDAADIRPVPSSHIPQLSSGPRIHPAPAYGGSPAPGSYPVTPQLHHAPPAVGPALSHPPPSQILQSGYGNRSTPTTPSSMQGQAFNQPRGPIGIMPPPPNAVPTGSPASSLQSAGGNFAGIAPPHASQYTGIATNARPPVSAASPPSQFGSGHYSGGGHAGNIQDSPKIVRPTSTIPPRAQLPSSPNVGPVGGTTASTVGMQQRAGVPSLPVNPRMQHPPNSPQRMLPTGSQNLPTQPVPGMMQGTSPGWGNLNSDSGGPAGPAMVPPDMSYRSVTGPPTSGGLSTAPHATANPVTPGLPTSWPVPTPVQQQLSPGIVPPPKSALLPTGPLNDPVPHNEIAILQQSFTGLLERCAQDGNRRKWDDIGKKLSELYDKLAAGQISRDSVAKIKEMCNCIDRGDFINASRLRVELSASDWEKNRTWLFAVQLLLPK